MPIGNYLFSPIFENPREFAVWYVLIHATTHSIER